MSINIYKQTTNFKNTDTLQLLFNTLFQDFENIRYFDKSDMYFEGDIVYVSKEVSNESKDYFFECIKNAYKGEFTKNYFKKLVLQNKNKRLLSEFRFTSPDDTTIDIPLDMTISIDRVDVTVIHSVKGKLILDNDWIFKSNNTIQLKENLFTGEYLDISIFQ